VSQLVFNADPLEEARRVADRAASETYYMRADNGKIVKDQREFSRCLAKGVALSEVGVAEASASMEAEGLARQARREKKQRRRARG
jgi:hypothetical protein